MADEHPCHLRLIDAADADCQTRTVGRVQVGARTWSRHHVVPDRAWVVGAGGGHWRRLDRVAIAHAGAQGLCHAGGAVVDAVRNLSAPGVHGVVGAQAQGDPGDCAVAERAQRGGRCGRGGCCHAGVQRAIGRARQVSVGGGKGVQGGPDALEVVLGLDKAVRSVVDLPGHADGQRGSGGDQQCGHQRQQSPPHLPATTRSAVVGGWGGLAMHQGALRGPRSAPCTTVMTVGRRTMSS